MIRQIHNNNDNNEAYAMLYSRKDTTALYTAGCSILLLLYSSTLCKYDNQYHRPQLTQRIIGAAAHRASHSPHTG